MKKFTLHIFGYGETQINSEEFSLKVSSSELTKVQPLSNIIWAKRPDGIDANEFHAINIFSYDDARWLGEQNFTVRNEPALKSKIDALISELRSIYDATVPSE